MYVNASNSKLYKAIEQLKVYSQLYTSPYDETSYSYRFISPLSLLGKPRWNQTIFEEVACKN